MAMALGRVCRPNVIEVEIHQPCARRYLHRQSRDRSGAGDPRSRSVNRPHVSAPSAVLILAHPLGDSLRIGGLGYRGKRIEWHGGGRQERTGLKSPKFTSPPITFATAI